MSKKKRNWPGVIILLVLLAAFPIISYIYMKKGFDYQLEARSELGDLGKVDPLPDTTISGDTLVGVKMGKQVALYTYFDPSDKATLDITGNYLRDIYRQFRGLEWFRMELLVPASERRALTSYQENKKMLNKEQLFYYEAPGSKVEVNKQIRIKDEWLDRSNCVALADTNGIVVNNYDLSDGKQLVRLVEHIAMLRPKEKKKAALFDKDREF